jgi:transcriptional regulator with XRE-family HTH domain
MRNLDIPDTNAGGVDRYLGGRLKELRCARGIGEGEFAAALGISVGLLQSFEAGSLALSAARLLQIASELKVTLPELFAGATLGAVRATWSPADGSHAAEFAPPDERELLDFLHAYMRLRDPNYRQRLVEALAIAAADGS